MSSSYRTRIHKLLSHLTVGSRVDFGKRRGPQQRGRFLEFLETRQLLSVSPADTTVTGPISHAPFNFSSVTFQVNSGTLTDIEFTTLPADGTLTFHNTPVVANSTDIPITDLANLTYTATAGVGGQDVFQWDGSDDGGSTFSTIPANLNINVNHQPTLSALSDSVVHDHSLTIPASQLTGAYTDADSDPMQSITFATLPSNGTLKLNGNTIVAGNPLPIAQFTGNLTYTPNAGHTGPDSFTWNASDGLDNAATNATFSLTATDAAPTLSNINNANVSHDQTLTIAPSLFINAFSDTDSGDALSNITFVSTPAHGILKINGSNISASGVLTAAQLTGGTMTYTPDAGYSGSDSFSWNASDGILSAASNATFNINVNDQAPTLTTITANLGHDQLHTFSTADFTSHFTDADGDSLQSVTIATVPAHGKLTLGNTTVTANMTIAAAQLANLTYTPTAGYTGADSFTWNASDGLLSAASNATLTLNVLTDSAPVIASPPFVGVLFQSTRTFSLADFDPTGNGTGTTQYTDADHNPLVSITITSLPTKGTLFFNNSPVVANQTIAAGDISSLVYKVNTGVTSEDADQFNFTASDGTLTSLTNTGGVISSSPASFIVAIVNPSDLSVSNLTVTVGENRSHTILSTDFASNVSLAKGSAFPATKLGIVTLPSHGTLTAGGVRLTAGQVIDIADITYAPTAGYTGPDSFTWSESPDNAHFAPPGSVNLTVTLPTDTAITKFVAQDVANTFAASEFSSHFTAIDNGTFVGVQITSLPTKGVLKLGGVAVGAGQVITAANIASLTYTPNTGYTGSDSFQWAGGDGVALATPVDVDITVLPPLSLIGNGQILQQNAKPSVVNFTDFRNWTIAADASMGTDTRSFTIRNSSTSDMSFAGISSIGANKGDFIIIAPDRARLTNGAFVLSPGDSATFSVQFLPLGIGLRSSVIALRDGNGAIVFQFAVQGTALASRPVVTTTFDSGGNPVKGLTQVATTRNGSGPAAANGHIVSIKYTGYLATSGFVFDDSANHVDTVNGFELRLDSHFTDGSTTSQPFLNKDQNGALAALGIIDISVIPGWEFALQGIKAGEKRTLIINSTAGYGDQGKTGIPPGATLVFDVECVFVDPPPTIVLSSIVSGSSGNSIFKLPSGQTATSADNGTLLTLSNTSSSSSITQTYNYFTIAADDINGNILANVTFNTKKPLTITGKNSPDFTNLTFTENQFGPAVQVTFHPLSTGLKTIQIHINSNDAQHPDYNFTVQGNAGRYSDIAAGFDTSLNLPPKPVISGSGQTIPVAVTITNTGDTSLPGNSKTNLQIYAHNVTTGALTLVGYMNNINVSGLGVGGIRVFTPQIALPLDDKSPFSKFPAGTYTFTAAVNQAHITANASISGLVALPPVFSTMVEADGSASKMIDNNTSDSASATIITKKPVNRGITVTAGQYVLGGSLGASTIVAAPGTGAHGTLTINVQNLGNIQTIPAQILSIDLFARPIANNSLPTVTLLSNHAISAGRIGVGGTATIQLPIAYNGATRFRNTTYVLIARVKLVDTGGNVIGGQQVISLDRNLNAVLVQA